MKCHLPLLFSLVLLVPVIPACAAQPASAGQSVSSVTQSSETVIYDPLANAGPVRAIGQNLRVGTSATPSS